MFQVGSRFGSWIVLGPTSRKYFKLCRCSCGTKKEIYQYHLRDGKTTSCGCQRNTLLSKSKIQHGENTRKDGSTPEYRTWKALHSRCSNKNTVGYKNYGGRGIKVCERWGSYENFIADMGRKPSASHSIERRDNNGDYEPNNCCWATRREQMNNVRKNVLLAYNGKTLTLSQWARETEIPYETLRSRVKAGGSPEEILERR